VTRPDCHQRRSQDDPRRLFVGCVTRPDCHQHRTQTEPPRLFIGCVTRPGDHQRRTQPLPPRLFVGCVTRPRDHQRRAQITPPRNTPEPKPLPVTNPWCVRGAGLTTPPSNALAPTHTPYGSLQLPSQTEPPRLFVGCVTRPGDHQRRTQPLPPRLFVGCVTRPRDHQRRAQITPPRNTPEPKPHPVTNPWCVRGAGFTTPPANALAPTHTPYGSLQLPSQTEPPRLFVGCVTRPRCHQRRAQITPPRNTPEPKPHPVTNPWCVRGAGFTTPPANRPRPGSHTLRVSLAHARAERRASS
jgi:hypothetical protein